MDLAGWIPITVAWEQDQPVLRWCYLGAQRFTAPFFDQTIESALALPFNRLFVQRTSFALIENLPAGVPPAGFIFHGSRCGSTLMAQMLSQFSHTLVLSEPSPLTKLLMLISTHPSISDEQCIAWVRGLVRALGQPRQGAETRLFIKFDAWAMLFFPLLRRAFPAVPWVFVYREPLAVLRSQQIGRGSQMIPGSMPPHLVGLEFHQLARISLDGYCAHVLANLYHQAELHVANGGLLINYRQLPDAVTTIFAAHVGLSFSAAAREQVRSVTQHHAKHPDQPWTPAEDNLYLTDELRRLTEALAPFYQRLEQRNPAAASDSSGG